MLKGEFFRGGEGRTRRLRMSLECSVWIKPCTEQRKGKELPTDPSWHEKWKRRMVKGGPIPSWKQSQWAGSGGGTASHINPFAQMGYRNKGQKANRNAGGTD